jgi:DNA-binding response OmpR family regulator
VPDGDRTSHPSTTSLDLERRRNLVLEDFVMDAILKDRAILIVEDEPLIAMEIVRAFESAGARVLKTSTLRQALVLVEDDVLSAAVLDHGLTDGDSSKLCERLKELGIPFVVRSGYSAVDGACRDAVFVAKPENPEVLVTTVERLLRNHPISH